MLKSHKKIETLDGNFHVILSKHTHTIGRCKSLVFMAFGNERTQLGGRRWGKKRREKSKTWKAPSSRSWLSWKSSKQILPPLPPSQELLYRLFLRNELVNDKKKVVCWGEIIWLLIRWQARWSSSTPAKADSTDVLRNVMRVINNRWSVAKERRARGRVP